MGARASMQAVTRVMTRGHDRGHGGNRRNDDDRGDRQRHSYNGSNRERSRQRR